MPFYVSLSYYSVWQLNSSTNKSANLLAPFAKYACLYPQQLALSVNDCEYSYGQLLSAVQRVAGWIVAQSIEKGARIGILANRDFSGYASIYAAVWAGVTYVPLNPKLPLERIKKIVKHAQLNALIVDDAQGKDLRNILGETPNIPVLSLKGASGSNGSIIWDGEYELDEMSLLEQPLAVDDSLGVYIMFTSGTTGEPKGILATIANLRHYLNFMQQRYRVQPADRLSQLFELSFDASAFDLFMSINHGASFHTVPENQLLTPASFIKHKELTIWFGVPSNIAFMQKMKLLQPNSFPGIRVSVFGGEPLTWKEMRAWRMAAPNAIMDNVYGPTEATVTCFIQRCDDTTPVTEGRAVMSIGRPYTGNYGAIVDESGAFLAAGEKGELIIAGPQVTPGYWQDDKLTNNRFRIMTHPEYGEQRWYFTGDLAIEDPCGTFHHLGRIDNQVKVSGHRVELEEIDSILREAAESDAVAAVPWPIEDGTARGIVAFVCQSEQGAGEMRAYMQKQLPAHMVPRRIILTDTLPYTLNGKVDRKALIEKLRKET